MSPFATLPLLILFQYQSLDYVYSSEKVLDGVVVEKICNSFGEVKCPYDDYCFYNKWGDHQACHYCPSGGKEDDCDRYSGRYTKCPTSHKYYDKYYACIWGNNCPVESKINNNTLTTRFDEECEDYNCRRQTRGKRPFICAHESKCVKDESECNICTSTYGGNETLCTEQYCKSLELIAWDRDEFGKGHKFIKCPNSGKCILKGQWCNGIGDCPGNEDEVKCSKEDCQKIGKNKCPYESKCIEDRFVCRDNDRRTDPRNKCKFRNDCIAKCEEDQTRFFCPHFRPSNSKAKWMDENCLLLNQQCNNPDENLMKILNISHKLWRCSLRNKQYIPIDKVCDGEFDCLMNEDESENICKRVPITMAIAYSSATVSGIVTIMICLKSFSVVTHKFMCKECLKLYAHNIENEQWIKIRRLLTMLVGEECKELVTSTNVHSFMTSSWLEQQNAYLDLHHNPSNMKPIFKYIGNRFEAKLTFHNLARIMDQRQKIYERIYNFEIQCHDGEKVKATVRERQRMDTGIMASFPIALQWECVSFILIHS